MIKPVRRRAAKAVMDAPVYRSMFDERRRKSYLAHAFKAKHWGIQFIMVTDSLEDSKALFAGLFPGMELDVQRAGRVLITPVSTTHRSSKRRSKL